MKTIKFPLTKEQFDSFLMFATVSLEHQDADNKIVNKKKTWVLKPNVLPRDLKTINKIIQQTDIIGFASAFDFNLWKKSLNQTNS